MSEHSELPSQPEQPLSPPLSGQLFNPDKDLKINYAKKLTDIYGQFDGNQFSRKGDLNKQSLSASLDLAKIPTLKECLKN